MVYRQLGHIVAAALMSLTVLLLPATAALATPPLNHLENNIIDEAGVLTDAGRAKLENAIAQLPANETLYVVYVDSFDGLTGAQWAAQTHDQANLDSAWLLAIAVEDRLWGTGYLNGTDSSLVSMVNTSVQDTLRNYRVDPDNFDWATPGVMMAEVIANPTPNTETEQFAFSARSILVVGVIGAIGVLIGHIIETRNRHARAYTKFDNLWSLKQLPVEPEIALADTRRQISIVVDLLTEYDTQISSLAKEYTQLAMDLYEQAKIAINTGKTTVYGRPVLDVLNDARAYARAGLSAATGDADNNLSKQQLSKHLSFNLDAPTWLAIQLASDHPKLEAPRILQTASRDGSFNSIVRSGVSGSFGDFYRSVGGSFENSFGNSFTGRGGSFAPTQSFDRGPGGDLHVPPPSYDHSSSSSNSSFSFGGSMGSGGSF